MFKTLRREFMVVNMLLIFILLCTALVTFYFITEIRLEQSITKAISSYMSTPINDIRNDEENPRLFISEIDFATYEYIQPLLNSNIFKYFNTLYANDSFSSSQTNSILSQVVKNSDYVSTIKVDERHYKYMKQKTDSNKVKIVVLDITNSLNSLRSTEIVLLLIAAISLILIFFVSKFITDRSIRPIEKMFDRQMEFFSDISHELKTPLTVAITNLAVIESHQQESVESQEKWIGYLKFQLDRLSCLVNEMLFLESMSSYHPYEQREHIDFSALIDRHIKSMSALMENKNLTLDSSIQGGVFVYADKEAMTRLISVLIDNAVNYTPEKGVITVSLLQSAKRTTLSVENTGEGIEPEHIGRIFDRLYRVSKSRSRNEGGKGLGLAIAKSVVEKYGGSINVESKVGEKTAFHVRLPR